MTIRIALPPFLSDRTGGRAVIEVRASTVHEALAELGESFPEVQSVLWRPAGGLNPFLVVFLNERDIQEREGLRTPLRDGDEIVLVAALEGG